MKALFSLCAVAFSASFFCPAVSLADGAQEASGPELRHDPRPVEPSMAPGLLSEYKSLNIQKWFQDLERIMVRFTLRLGAPYVGREMEFVEIQAQSSNFGYGEAQLVVNGRVTGYPQQIGPQRRNYRFYLEPGQNVIGHGADTVVLIFRGTTYVHTLGAFVSGSDRQPH